MIRAQTATGWLLVTHPDHARLAGELADAWGNDQFAPPEPYAHVRHAVYHHDDGWLGRDAAPSLTKDGKPEAFTKTLVGAYSAFEEIDLPNYVRVRGEATAAVAAQDLYAGVIVSMHTYNLLTEQADATTIRPDHRPAYERFLAEQLAWQKQTAQSLGADHAALQQAFEFLQGCDNFSLIACSGYDLPRDLRHTHPDRSGHRHAIRCEPLGDDTYRLSPWPLRQERLELRLPWREVPAEACVDLPTFRTAFTAAPVRTRTITLVR